nr:cyclopropane fatty acyl phospholipid synthase [Aliidiomarina halalkaliphila]
MKNIKIKIKTKKGIRMNSSYRLAERLLQTADIEINGGRPWDLQLHDARALAQALARGNLGLGEAYMDHEWDCDALDEFFYRILREKVHQQISPSRLLWHALKNRWFNLQSHKRAWQVGKVHYDLGNAFYQAMLDSRMTYTCGYWKHARSLEEAQAHKLELTCRKLELQPGMKVLDIGCGWGSFMQYASEHYGVECVGITISKQQAALARERCAGYPIEVHEQDYRSLDMKADRVVSLGMFEHVGPKNHRTFFEVVNRCLVDDGLALLHTIGRNRAKAIPDPFIAKYIFPNGELPALQQISSAVEGLFVVEDLHNFGADYDLTLMAWHRNFENHWHRFQEEYGDRFYRMWRYYLLSCAGAFRARDIQLWQWVLSPKGKIGGYQRPTLT